MVLRKQYDNISAEIDALRAEWLSRPLVGREEFDAESGYGFGETFEQYCARREELRARIRELEDEQFELSRRLF